MEAFNFSQWIILFLLMMILPLLFVAFLYFQEHGESDKLIKENNALQRKIHVHQAEIQRLENGYIDLKNEFEQLRELANSTGRRQTVLILEQRQKEIIELKKRIRELEESRNYAEREISNMRLENTLNNILG